MHEWAWRVSLLQAEVQRMQQRLVDLAAVLERAAVPAKPNPRPPETVPSMVSHDFLIAYS
ncbi:MAG: hypothetical protein ACYDDF_15400 [Thermoplasmatota archaeon]